MKKSLSKKILAMFLAVLMLATSIPVVAYAEEGVIDDAKVAIAKYETIVKKQYVDEIGNSYSYIYRNMEKAYSKYIICKELIDAYTLGDNTGATGQLTRELQRLNDAITNMGALDENGNPQVDESGMPVPTALKPSSELNMQDHVVWKNSFDNTAGSNDVNVSKSVTKNVLFADTFSNAGTDAVSSLQHAAYGGAGSAPDKIDGYNVNLYYGDSVLLYDGITTPTIPVLASVELRYWWGATGLIGTRYALHYLSSIWPRGYGQTIDSKNVPNNKEFRVWNSAWAGAKEEEIKSQSWCALSGGKTKGGLTDDGVPKGAGWSYIKGGDSKFATLFNNSNPMFCGYGVDIDGASFGGKDADIGMPVQTYYNGGRAVLFEKDASGKDTNVPVSYYGWYYYASTLQYKNVDDYNAKTNPNGWSIERNLGTGSYANPYVKSIRVPWGDHLAQNVYWGSSTSVSKQHSFGYNEQPTSLATNVINYRAIQDLYKTVQNSTILKNIDKYDAEYTNVEKFMASIDSLMDTVDMLDDPITYQKQSGDKYVADVQTGVNTISTNLVNADNGIKASSSINMSNDYGELRTELKIVRDIYAKGQRLYTDETWDVFKSLYRDIVWPHVNRLGSIDWYEPNKVGMYEGGYAQMLQDARLALEEGIQTSASFKYVPLKEKLEEMLSSGEYTSESVNAVKTFMEKTHKLQFWELTVEQWKWVPDTKDKEINDEIEILNQAIALLKQPAEDKDNYDLTLVGLETLNADSIDFSIVETDVENAKKLIKESINILGTDYVGLNYDAATEAIITSINTNRFDYIIKWVDSQGITRVMTNRLEGGEMVQIGYPDSTEEDIQNEIDVLRADGELLTYHYNDVVKVEDIYAATNNVPSDIEYHWTLSAIAKKTQLEQKPIYIGEGEEIEFIVRGDTTLRSSSLGEDAAYNYYSRIKFVDAITEEVLDVQYINQDDYYGNSQDPFNGEFDIANANIPDRAFYEVVDYECDDPYVDFYGTLMSGIYYGSNLTVKVFYAPTEKQGDYSVMLLDSYGKEVPMAKNQYKYAQRATFAYADAKAFVRAELVDGKYVPGEFLATGNEFTYEIYEDIAVMAVSEAPKDVTVSVVKNVATTGDNSFFHGSYTGLPEGAEVLSGGIVLDRYNTCGDKLSLAKVDNAKGIYNLSTFYFRDTTQFGAKVLNTPLTSPISYRAYVIYKLNPDDENEIAKIAYSDVVTNYTVQY